MTNASLGRPFEGWKQVLPVGGGADNVGPVLADIAFDGFTNRLKNLP